ncbi:hypothetical protein RSSM_06074 [Rhodopirellula sallentina SM41]|uniref:Uncharacterized protein n=1 Tax=Rhodopirellula sallentina SM41 TaxID=1263870 RepID=M5TTY3_9BACT|nr:hypothetical protein RSSM_06074 [Rhodopirellula sallentina SM41]
MNFGEEKHQGFYLQFDSIRSPKTTDTFGSAEKLCSAVRLEFT